MSKVKISQDRSGEIALAWIVWKYGNHKVRIDPKKVLEKIERRSRQIGEKPEMLYQFIVQVITPAICHWRMVWAGNPATTSKFESIALKLAPYELYQSDEEGLAAQAMKFQKNGLSPFSLAEVFDFRTRHILEPARARKAEIEAAKTALLNPKINRN